jgi:metal-dependent hydrolase (beta-lactamase superfamily II)
MTEITSKPIKYVIGGLHMAHATNKRMKSTIEFLKKLNDYEFSLTLFPIHCSGKEIIWEIKKLQDLSLSAFDTSVGTKFVFSS